MTRRKVTLSNFIGAEIAHANEATINEELEDSHHDGVVIGHILANIENTVRRLVKSIDTNLFSTEGLDSSDVT